jgi:uncharacterized protein (TIGR03437 family)
VDGQWVAYLSVIGDRPQVFHSRIDGSDWRQLTADVAGVPEVALAGDRRTVVAVTGAGALLRIGAWEGDTEELTGHTSHDLKRSGAPTPGLLNILIGARLASAEEVAGAKPLPEELGGTQMTMGGVPTRLASVSATKIVFQIPWELQVPVGPARTMPLVWGAGSKYFETSIPVMLTEVLAETMAVVHEGFESLVTRENPARPGEIVHIYATGLGPVAPAVASGVAPPEGTLSRVVMPWAYTWQALSPDRQSADVLFAGLAPGMTGVYQVDVRVPSPAPRDPVIWAKHPNGPLYTFAWVPVMP